MTATFTLNLSDETHAALLADADTQGRDPAALVAALLEKAYEDCEAEVYYLLAERLKDDGSHDISLEDFASELRNKRRQRPVTLAEKVLTAA